MRGTASGDAEACRCGDCLRWHKFVSARCSVLLVALVACSCELHVGIGSAVRLLWPLGLCGDVAPPVCRTSLLCGSARGPKAGSKYAARFRVSYLCRKACPPTVGGQRFGYGFALLKRASFEDRVCGHISSPRPSFEARAVALFPGRRLRLQSGPALSVRVWASLGRADEAHRWRGLRCDVAAAPRSGEPQRCVLVSRGAFRSLFGDIRL